MNSFSLSTRTLWHLVALSLPAQGSEHGSSSASQATEAAAQRAETCRKAVPRRSLLAAGALLSEALAGAGLGEGGLWVCAGGAMGCCSLSPPLRTAGPLALG